MFVIYLTGPMVVLEDRATGNRNYIAHPPYRGRCKELKMYFSQAFITSVFAEQVKQNSSENDEFKYKPYDKSPHSRPRRTQNLNFKIALGSRHQKNRFYCKIILSLASIHT